MDKIEIAEDRTSSSSAGLLGEYLKQKRIDNNYTLEKMAQKTKISMNILKSLESNDFEHLPSAAYIKGFVRSYVKLLGLPLDEAINKMEYTYLNVLGKPFPALNHTKLISSQSAIPQENNQEDSPSPHEVIESGDTIIKSTKSLLPVFIFALVILFFVGGYKMISNLVETEAESQKGKNLGAKIESSSALVKNQDQTTKVSKTKVSEVKVPGPQAGAKTPTKVATKEESSEVSGPAAEAAVTEKEFVRNFPKVDFRKIRTKLFSVIADAPENSDESLLPPRIKNSMNPELQNVYIRAVDGTTWLSYKIDNNPIESIIVNKGNDLFLQGEDIRVFLGNVNITKIFYNNYLIDTPTKSGVKSLVFPEESNQKYQLPLFPKANDDVLYTSEEYSRRMKIEEEELAKQSTPSSELDQIKE